MSNLILVTADHEETLVRRHEFEAQQTFDRDAAPEHVLNRGRLRVKDHVHEAIGRKHERTDMSDLAARAVAGF